VGRKTPATRHIAGSPPTGDPPGIASVPEVTYSATVISVFSNLKFLRPEQSAAKATEATAPTSQTKTVHLRIIKSQAFLCGCRISQPLYQMEGVAI